MKKELLLNQLFDNNIFTRSSIVHLFEKIKKTKETDFILNFKNIDFISRSCADEYLKQKNNSTKNISEKNISKNVCSMFQNVKNQYQSLGIQNSSSLIC